MAGDSIDIERRQRRGIGYVWDENKYQKVKREHRVEFYEVVSTLDDPNGHEDRDPQGHEDRWLWVGQTADRRTLAVVYSEEDLPLYRIITAFDAEGKWLDEYEQR